MIIKSSLFLSIIAWSVLVRVPLHPAPTNLIACVPSPSSTPDLTSKICWSCGKVMFLHPSVSHSVHRGEGVSVWCHFLFGCLVPCSFQGVCRCSHVPSGGVYLTETPWTEISRHRPPVQRPPDRDLHGQKPPWTETPLYGKGGMHPTGMNSCWHIFI